MKNRNQASMCGLIMLTLLGTVPVYLQLQAKKHHKTTMSQQAAAMDTMTNTMVEPAGSDDLHEHLDTVKGARKCSKKRYHKKQCSAQHKKHKSCTMAKKQHKAKKPSRQVCKKRAEQNKFMKMNDQSMITFTNAQMPPTAKILWNAISCGDTYEKRHEHNTAFRKSAVDAVMRQSLRRGHELDELFKTKHDIKTAIKTIDLDLDDAHSIKANVPYSVLFIKEALEYGKENTEYTGTLSPKMRKHFKGKVIMLSDAKRYLHDVVKPEIRKILEEYSILN